MLSTLLKFEATAGKSSVSPLTGGARLAQLAPVDQFGLFPLPVQISTEGVTRSSKYSSARRCRCRRRASGFGWLPRSAKSQERNHRRQVNCAIAWYPEEGRIEINDSWETYIYLYI